MTDAGRPPAARTDDGASFADRLRHRLALRGPGWPAELQATFYDVDAKVEWMDRNKVDIAVISVGPPIYFYWLSPDAGLAACKLANDGKTTYKGQQVVAIRDRSDNSKLYVAATGKPYPVAIVGGKGNESGTITFGDWNKQVSLSAPGGAIDISRFGG